MNNKTIRLPAPAKLNLMLRIVGRRSDGYHLLQTVFQFVELCDWVTLRVQDDDAVRLANPLPGVPEETDLTVRAAMALKTYVNNSELGARISVEKNLPMGGGLGGGSSDAATVLVGLNALWNLNLSQDELASIGLKLGADVPVFVRGQAAWAEGVGEHLTTMTDLPEPWYAIVVPNCHVATAAVFNSPDLTRNSKPMTMRDFLLGDRLNDCLPVVLKLYPEIADAMQELAKHSPEPRLTGTGACIFAEFENKSAASAAADNLSERGLKVFVSKGVNQSALHRTLISGMD
jgi:4-diphosphocytidyl-2-C-methyl-D-erythritol kinase